jgi:hypothetical protein
MGSGMRVMITVIDVSSWIDVGFRSWMDRAGMHWDGVCGLGIACI